jgi:tight adherence protein B
MTALTFAIVALLVIAIGLGLFMLTAGQRRLARRAKRIGSPESRAAGQSGPQLRVGRPGGLDTMVAKFLPRPALLRQRLASSGTGLTLGTYALICLNVGIAVFILALLRKTPFVAALLVGTLGGLLLPHFAMGYLIGQRRKKFRKLFPDAIGLMVRGLKAGLPPTESMVLVGREVADPVGEEFRKVSDQVRLGQGMEEALWGIAKRLEMPEFNFFVITLMIQRETGGNLAETLTNLDDMLRKRDQMKMKVKAMSSEATATAGIIGALPFAMAALLFFVSRSYIMTLFTTDLGHVLLAGGLVWMSIGFFTMSQMIRFDI